MDKINNSYHVRIKKTIKSVILIVLILLFIFAVWNFKGMYKPNAKSSSKEDKKISLVFPELYSVNEENIYYISLADNCIYGLNIDNGTRQLISGNRANEIGLIYDNGWIYYISLEDFSLNRVNVDNKKVEEISENLLCSSENFLEYNDSLYYFDDSLNIHMVYQDGSSSTVNDELKVDFISGVKRYTKLSEQWIYTWDMFSIYRASIEGGKWEKIMDNIYPLYEVYGDYIYYIDNNDLKLYKTNLNTMEKEMLCSHYVIQQGADFDGGNMEIDGDNLYHTAFLENGKANIYKINLKNGTESIAADMTLYFTIHDGSLYYMDDFDSGKLYKKKLKNSYESVLTSGGFMPYIDVKDGILLYASKSVDIDDSEDGRILVLNMDKKLQFELK